MYIPEEFQIATTEPISLFEMKKKLSLSEISYCSVEEQLPVANARRMGAEFASEFSRVKEQDVPEKVGAIYLLTQNCCADEIYRHLSVKGVMHIAHLLKLLRDQAQGGRGVLLVDPQRTNISFIRNGKGIVKLVEATRFMGTWYLNACAIRNDMELPVSSYILSAHLEP